MTIIIDLIPSNGLTPKEFELLTLCAASHRIELDPPPPESLLITLDAEWLLLVHWLYKKGWEKKHKLPWMREEKSKALSLEGEAWWKLLELCRGVRDYLESERRNPGSAFDRWGSILLKCRLLELKKLYHPTKCSGLKGGKTGKGTRKEGGKRALKSIFHGKLRLLGDSTEPSNPFNRKTNPQLYGLIQDALYLAGKYSNFRDGYWKPFLDAYREWTAHLDHKGTFLVWAEKDEKTGEWVWYQRDPEADRGKKKILTDKSSLLTLTE